jgi:hypothetical protein
MAAEVPLSAVRDDALDRVPNPPALADLVEDAGRQRLAAYYLCTALLAGVLDGDDLAPAGWPRKLAEPMQRLGLARLAPRTWAGLEVQLTPDEQGWLRSQDRQSEFARLLIDMINQGAFGPLCGDADSVRLTTPGQAGGNDLALIKDDRVVGTCKVVDHWELVAQHLAGAPALHAEAGAETAPTVQHKVESQLKETGIAHAVSLGANLAVDVHPLGAAVGLGTRLVRARIRTGRDEAGTLRDLGQDLGAVRDQANEELADLHARGSSPQAGGRRLPR